MCHISRLVLPLLVALPPGPAAVFSFSRRSSGGAEEEKTGPASETANDAPLRPFSKTEKVLFNFHMHRATPGSSDDETTKNAESVIRHLRASKNARAAAVARSGGVDRAAAERQEAAAKMKRNLAGTFRNESFWSGKSVQKHRILEFATGRIL